jgi:hypothetical protein
LHRPPGINKKSDHASTELRRRLLKLVGAFFLAEGLPLAAAFAATPPSAAERRAFAAFLDVVLPRDALSGSASDLRVDTELWAFAARDARFRRLVELGCRWLNMTGRGSFAALPATDQFTVVTWMSGSDWDEIPRRFYELARQVAVETYYSHPAALAGLPIKAPPQPAGYPPPWE